MKFAAVVCVVVFALLAVAFSLKDPACGLPPDEGQCLAYMPRYSYKAENNSCQEFIYGGCGGNDNRFYSLEECEDKCKE